jgi:flagellar assembly factor FliW
MKAQQELFEPIQNLETRLGVIQFDRNSVYSFTKGLYGFELLREYIFAPLPGLSIDMNYMLLQSTEMPNLCFVVMKIDPNTQPSEFAELKPHLDNLGLNLSDVLLGLIITFNPDKTNQERVIFNRRAPLIFSLNSQDGWQIILE